MVYPASKNEFSLHTKTLSSRVRETFSEVKKRQLHLLPFSGGFLAVA